MLPLEQQQALPLLGYLLLAHVLNICDTSRVVGEDYFLIILFFKKEKRQTVENTFIECNRKPSDTDPLSDWAAGSALERLKNPSALTTR